MSFAERRRRNNESVILCSERESRGIREIISKNSERRRDTQKQRDVELVLSAFMLNIEGVWSKTSFKLMLPFYLHGHNTWSTAVTKLEKQNTRHLLCLSLFHLASSSHYLIWLSLPPYIFAIASRMPLLPVLHQMLPLPKGTERALGSFCCVHQCISKISGGLFDTSHASAGTRAFSALQHPPLLLLLKHQTDALWVDMKSPKISRERENIFSKFLILKSGNFCLDVRIHGLSRDGIFLPVYICISPTDGMQ